MVSALTPFDIYALSICEKLFYFDKKIIKRVKNS
jgi:hypothetical protein